LNKHTPPINAIACISQNRGIGKDGGLLFSIPDDMKFFREKTMGAVIIMGRKTLESFAGGKPLRGRENVVLTRNREFSQDGVTAFCDFEKLKSHILNGGYGDKPIFIIGGAEIYTLFLPVTDILLLTEVKKTVDSDKYFPEYSKEFVKSAQTETMFYQDLAYTFNEYLRKERIGDTV
jgi:dihydrofolate reductase